MKEDDYMFRYFSRRIKEKSEHFRPYTIEGFPGPMFSGKTRRLLERVDPLRFDPRKYLYIGVKPSLDDRAFNVRGMEDFIEWNYIENSKDIYSLSKGIDVIAIDEVSFFDEGIINVINTLKGEGKNIIWAGLDRDFRGESFPVVKELMVNTDILEKCKAVCTKCGGAAYYTQRLIDGEPAPYDSPVISIEGETKYEARCYEHHYVPGKK